MDVSGYEVDGGPVFAPHLGGELPLVGTTRNEAPNQPLVLIPHITPQGKLSTPTPQKNALFRGNNSKSSQICIVGIFSNWVIQSPLQETKDISKSSVAPAGGGS